MSATSDTLISNFVEPAGAVFAPETSVRDAIDTIRELVKKRFVTYAYVTDPAEKLLGVIAMRDLLLAEAEQPLSDVMLKNPFALQADMELEEAMRKMVNKHFPCYPVTEAGKLAGIVWGAKLFEAHAVEITAQAGKMVGVEKEERLSTPVSKSFFFRYPWLQINLFTAFIAAAVVGLFQHTIEKIVILTVFLPLLSNLSGNAGCQALAVTLRGMALHDLRKGMERRLIMREALLGLFNGFIVGLTAGVAMYIYARSKGNDQAIGLACIVCAAMATACMMGGIAGTLVPLTLRKLGADPATASSIFLTTITDVVSMGSFLTLAFVFLL